MFFLKLDNFQLMMLDYSCEAEPCIAHTVVKPHGDEALWRTRSTRPQRLGGQQSLCCNSTRSSIQTERTFLDQNPYQEIDTLFIGRIRNPLQP
jgi:hypothetical protein